MAVLKEIGPKLIQPLSAFSKGGSRGDRCENVGLSYLIGIEAAVYPVTDRRIGNDDGCGLKAGQIEGFGGGHTGDAVFPAVLGDGGERNIILPRLSEVAVDLVGKHQDMVFHTEVTHLFQCLLVPDLAHRVVGVTEDHKGGLGIGNLLFQVLEINGIGTIFVFQRAFQDVSSIVVNGIKENIVDRGENHDFFCRCGHFPDDTGDGGNHAGAENQPVSRNLEIVADFPPVLISLVPVVFDEGVAKYTVSGSFANRFLHCRSCLKIHIRYPHGKFLRGHIPFHASGAPAVCLFIKNALHRSSLLLYHQMIADFADLFAHDLCLRGIDFFLIHNEFADGCGPDDAGGWI